MKRRLLLFLILLFSLLIVGCRKTGEKEVVKDLTKKIEETKSYHLVGELEMLNNDDVYKTMLMYHMNKKISFALA